MFAEERQQLIVGLIYASGRASVTDLAERFSITTETVRRDLAALEAAGKRPPGPRRRGVPGPLQHHGGKHPGADRPAAAGKDPDRRGRPGPHSPGPHRQHPDRRRLHHGGPRRTPVRPGRRSRRAGHRPASGSDAELVVITHSLPIASRLSGEPGIALHLLGGKVRGLTQAAVGQSTVEAARRIRPDIAFIGTNGIHAAFGLSTPDPEEAAVKAAFVQSARRIVVLADSSKLDAETLVQFASLKDLDTVITDTKPSRELADALAEAGVEVVVA